jgi:hypothetical protein
MDEFYYCHSFIIVKKSSIIFFSPIINIITTLALSLQGKLRQKQGSEPKASFKQMVKMKELLTQKRMHKNGKEAFPILGIRNPKESQIFWASLD